MITICDPWWNQPTLVDKEPVIVDENFIWWNGTLREIKDIHSTKQGTQIELY